MTEIATCSLRDLEPSPWKNGGGTTCELLLWPEEASLAANDFAFRVSIATIERDGEFSKLDGVDRLFLPLSGEAFKLEHETVQRSVPLRMGEIHRFDGEWATRAVGVHSPIRVLNVLCRRGLASATIERVGAGARSVRLALDERQLVLLVVEGSTFARVSGEEDPLELDFDTALWLRDADRGDELVLEDRSDDFLAFAIELR